MLAVLTISTLFYTGGTNIQVVPGPPNAMVLSANQRSIVAGATNIQTAKDRIYAVKTTSLVVTDYYASTARIDFPMFVSDNPSIPIDLVTGGSPFVIDGSASLFANCLISGTYAAYGVTYQSNTIAISSNLVGFANLSLASNIVFTASNAFSGKSVSHWPYSPAQADLGSNNNVWTYPPLMSCVGISSAGFQTCLISPNTVLANNHIGGAYGGYVTFTDVNGVKRIARYTGYTAGPNDFAVATLESNLTSAVVPASLFASYTTNKISSWLGVFTVWPHKNTSHMDLNYVNNYPVSGLSFTVSNAMFCANAMTNTFGNEHGATGGDSGSPCGFLLGNQFVLAFTATSPGDVGGDFLTDYLYWNWLTNHVPVATLNVVDVSSYPSY